MNILEKVARAIYEIWWHKIEGFAGDPYYGSNAKLWQNWSPAADAAIHTFLETAAEQGWHMRPDKATEEMDTAGHKWCWENGAPKCWRDMLAAAPEFKWKDDRRTK